MSWRVAVQNSLSESPLSASYKNYIYMLDVIDINSMYDPKIALHPTQGSAQKTRIFLRAFLRLLH
jgi:hypothetical protein